MARTQQQTVSLRASIHLSIIELIEKGRLMP
jgi:hypothetical protein